MTRHALLDNVTHRNLRVRVDYARGRGYDVNVARVFPGEFAELQRHYPLFLVKNAETGHFEAVALLGFENGENLFLAECGWDADYVPLSIRRQPFLIGSREQLVDGVPRQVPVVHIDLDHPNVSESEGEPLFLPHGGESPFLEQANAVLAAIHHGHDAMRSLSRMLVGLELVESVAVDVAFDDGSKRSLAGLYGINEDRLRALGAEGLEALHRKGHLQDVYMMLASLLSMSRLIARRNRRLAADRGRS